MVPQQLLDRQYFCFFLFGITHTSQAAEKEAPSGKNEKKQGVYRYQKLTFNAF